MCEGTGIIEQRTYLKYCNGAETFYSYDPQRRRLQNLVVNAKAGTIMDNAYSYDAVSNVLGIKNNAPLPQSGKAGGQMSHSYSYDPLYRLASATGTYAGADNKTASYTLAMGYDNMHRITSKKQHLSQTGVQFDGTLNAGYDLTYTYGSAEGKKFQLDNVRDINYRTEETPTESTNINNGHKYTYDANGNLVYINTSRVKRDGKEDEKTTEQKYRWDEENRLLAADENGFVSNYWYDADGERTAKTSGENEAIYVNSEFSGGNTGTARFSLYVSPYLVAGQGGKYTKHIYVGSQRIVSKLGDLASYGADPRRIPYAGNEADGLTINYKDKYAKQLQSIKDNYKAFDLPYNGKDNDDYINGQGFCCNDGTPEATQARAMARTRAANGNFKPNDDYEKMQFFYHPDHLGSSSYITNLDGEVAQHIEYVPFGEVFIEERNNTWNTPYLFNAKEFDKETGLYYYGARYMDPKISMWLGVDPMAEKYPNLTGYCYTMDNPIILIDPTGMEPDGWGGKNNENGTTTYTYDAKVTADNYSQLGYDVYKPNGSIINNATINGQTGENGQTSVYLGNNANDVSFTWPNSTVTPFQVGTEWLTGKGPRHRDFTNGDLFTEMLKKHEHIEDTRNMIINNVMNGGALKGTNPYKLGGIEGVGLYIRDYSTLITGGLTGNLAVTYLGSYNLDWVAKPNAENGTISVTFSIYNTSTMQSASRPPILGYLPIWQKTVGSMINKKFKKGWGSITSQSFRWTETLQMRR